MIEETRSDLIVLVADKNMEASILGLLGRNKSLGIRPLTFDIRRHPHKDSGCCIEGVEFLETFVNQYHHALLVFDHQGSSREGEKPADIEKDLEDKLSRSGWKQRSGVVVLEPELEAWVWSDSPEVDKMLGWIDRCPNLREWLEEKNFKTHEDLKHYMPKEAMEAALQEVKKPRSSSIYQALAESVSLNRCNDRTFIKLKDLLREWFAD